MCNHDLAEKETACADGMCPLCLSSNLQKLMKAVSQLEQHKSDCLNIECLECLAYETELYKILEEMSKGEVR